MNAPAFSTELRSEDMQFTPTAQTKLAELVSQVEDAAGIRIFISGGGCGGMAYGMTYADAETPYDHVFAGDGFKVFVDAVALNYLQGAEVDFKENGAQSSFVFNNVFKSVGGSGTCGTCGAAGGGCGSR